MSAHGPETHTRGANNAKNPREKPLKANKTTQQGQKSLAQHNFSAAYKETGTHFLPLSEVENFLAVCGRHRGGGGVLALTVTKSAGIGGEIFFQ